VLAGLAELAALARGTLGAPSLTAFFAGKGGSKAPLYRTAVWANFFTIAISSLRSLSFKFEE
jgi:hypothetical protein